jgi:signal peptidase II
MALVMATCVGCDQVFKAVARDSLAHAGTITLLRGAVRLEYVENPGAFLSLGASLPLKLRSLLFVGGAILVLTALLAVMARSRHGPLPRLLGLALVAGGAVGNLIDRVLHGSVVDFVSVGLGGLRTGVFNVADLAITAGVLILALAAGTDPAPQSSSPQES